MSIILYKNSLITLEDADLYFDERFDSNDWTTLTNSDKEKLLIKASKVISYFDFVGEKADETQPLAFPRNFEIPQDIKDAVCEEAYARINSSNNIHIINQNLNISSISLGAGSVSYTPKSIFNENIALCSNIAYYLISKWTKKSFHSK